jgi:hypothetical protein
VPEYTYRCPQGHEWDEFRSVKEDSQESTEACAACVEVAAAQPDLIPQHGRKIVPTGVSARFVGAGWTPKFYRDRKGK